MLFIAGVAALAFSGVCYVESAVYQTVARSPLGRLLPGSGGFPAERIEIPRLGIDAAIREGVGAHTMLIAVGHVPGTAMPGETGNVVLSAHRDTFFRNLRRIRVGDKVKVSTRGAAFVYRVESTAVVTPDRTDVLEPAGGRTLTLITCYPFEYIGRAPKRFIVKARQVEPVTS